jgi:hypothetical protein
MKNLRKMTILSLLLCLMQNVFGQSPLDRPVTVSYEQQRLSEIVTDLGRKYSIRFAYSSEAIRGGRRLSLSVKTIPMRQVLDELAEKTGLTWQLVSGQVILKPKPAQKQPASMPVQTIKGVVTDKESRAPIPGATIKLNSEGALHTTSTNAEGEFRITGVPVGRNEFIISMIGYQPAVLSGVLVNAGKELVLSIGLSEAVNEMQAVTLVTERNRQKPLNDLASVSARAFTVEETGRYAGGFFDPARMAQSFAGVTAGNDVNNDIVIRGNSSKGLQWRLEGIEIINPNHFGEEGSSAGGVSMISSSMLANSDFFTGAFPAEYGNALSGVFDLQFRTGNTDRKEYALMAGLLGIEAAAEGPFKKGGRSSYLFNYRYSTLSLLDKLGVDPGFNDAIPVYQDLAYNLVFPAKKAGTFSLFGIGGISRQKQEAEEDSNAWKAIDDKFNRSYGYNSFSTGIKHTLPLSGKAYLKNILSYSLSKITDDADTLTNTYQANVFGRDSYRNAVIRYSGMLNYKIDTKNTLRGGTVVSWYNFNLKSLSYRRAIGRLSEVLNVEGESFNPEFYLQWKRQINDRLVLNTGLHSSYFNLSSSWSAEPRVGLRWGFRPEQVLTFGAGIHSRLEPMAFYYGMNENPDGTAIYSNRKLSPTKAIHLVGGYERSLGKGLTFKTEAYFQRLFHVPVSSDPAVNFSALNTTDAYFIYSRNYRSLLNKGTGRNMGVEFTLERALNNGYYFLGTASLFDSKFKSLSGKWFSTNYDSKYAGSLVAGKEWKKGSSEKNLFGLNGKLVYTGGRRYTPVNLPASLSLDDQVLYEDELNTLSAAPYARLDFSMSYRVNRPGTTHSFFIDVQNLTNRQNELGVFYNGDKNKLETWRLSGIIPTINYRIEF